MKPKLLRVLKAIVIVVGVALVLIQFVPYGHDHGNPPVIIEPNWDSARTRELAVRACFDCHSNDTVWPWYSSIAPISWLVYRDVIKGRQYVNYSEWGQQGTNEEAHEAGETVLEGEMPVPIYLFTHPEARLTDAERQELAAGLGASR